MIDQNIFFAIHNLSGDNNFLDQLGLFFADHLLYVMVGFVILVWIFKDWNLRSNANLALATLVASRLVIVEIMKRVFARPRPFEALSEVQPLILDEDSLRSFPSGHAVIYFSIAFAFWGTKYFWPLFIAAVLGSVARVFVGVHYPSDVLTSAIIALLVAWGLRGLFKKPNLS
ncbi:MAG TPA: phosphatase PAP2 family protein [Candidatus Binatia bacterium]|nr:phosphatase PAP2 family protein [Candidatus Binatia bacterium]